MSKTLDCKEIGIGNPELNKNSFQNYKHWYLIHTWSDKAFKSTVVNRALPSFHGGSLEKTFTVTLNFCFREEEVKFELGLKRGKVYEPKYTQEELGEYLF